MRRLAVAALLLILPTPALDAQNCGGVERWAVKVGGDAGAAQLDVANPVPTSLHDLVSLPRPQLPSDETTRVPEERVVRVVDGRLVQFKLESGRTGDRDYHLVITDDTLQFTPGGASHPVSPHSFVAEIVDPACIAGRHGTSPVPSAFIKQIQTVYKEFRAQFPTITGGWNQAGGIAVRVTGVTFFDRPHGQTGRSLNGVEIHPILDIDFTPPVGPLPPPDAVTVVIQNPGFEAGVQAWTATADVITTNANEPARTGTWKAWLGGYGETHTDSLWQQITLPANAQALTLEFYLHVSSEEEQLEEFDRLRVRLRRPNGQILTTLRTYSNLQAAPGFARQTFNLTPYRGQTVRIELVSQEDGAKMTSFVVDDFRIIVE